MKFLTASITIFRLPKEIPGHTAVQDRIVLPANSFRVLMCYNCYLFCYFSIISSLSALNGMPGFHSGNLSVMLRL